MKAESKENELKNLIAVLRAIVISHKQPCTMIAVLKDFFELESQQLPYRDFGFDSPTDLFLKSGQFFINQKDGQTYLAAKSNKNSDHIAALVRSQKPSKSRHIVKPVNQPSQRTLPYPSFKGNRTQQTQKQQRKCQHGEQIQNQFKKELEEEKDRIQLKYENDIKARNEEISYLKARLLSLETLSLNKDENSLYEPNKNIDLVNKELELDRLENAELRRIADQLRLLSLDINNNKETYIKMLSPQETQNINEKSVQNPKHPRPQSSPAQKSKNNATQRNTTIKESKETTKRNGTQEQSQSIESTTKKKPQNSSEQANILTNNKQSNTSNSSSLQPTDLRHRLNSMRSQKQSEKREVVAPKRGDIKNEVPSLRPILGQNNNVGNQTTSSIHYINKNNNKIAQPLKQRSDQPVQQTFVPPTDMPAQTQPVRQIPKFPSVQHRLKLNLNTNKNFVNDNSITEGQSGAVAQPSAIQRKVEKTIPKFKKLDKPSTTKNRKIWKFDPKLDPCTSIAQYCAARNYGEPIYNVFRSKQGLFDCQLIIKPNTVYSTYPQEYTTEAIARLACAEKAIQQIRIVEARKLLPTFSNDKEFLNVLYRELLLHPNGIISDKMSEWFVDKFQHTMPEHWFSLIKKSARFVTESGIKEGTFIILANKDITESDSELDELADEPIQMEPLKLPWSEKSWQLFITHCTSTVEIWACLLAGEYNTPFNALMTELNDFMTERKVRPDVIALKHIYLVEMRSSWHRVRIESLDKENETAFCFYLDFGDADHLPVSALYLCDPKFLWLPPQAVPFSLFGLEDFAGHPNAIKYLQKRLLNRAVISEIVTKESEFERNGIIQAVMFDTSTEEDINLNLVLQEEICKHSQKPKLRTEGMTSVRVTYIDSESGDISLQIINADFEYVQNTLRQIVESKFNSDQHNCSAKELLRQQLLLVHDEDRSMEWCRAKLVDKNLANVVSGRDQLVDVLYIDYDIVRRVHISKIYRLESLSMALSKFPPQALRVKLHNIPELNQNTIGRMRALMPTNCEAFVRVELAGEVPEVTILRRVYGPDMPYCNINDDLRLEIERAKDATLCQKSSDGFATASTSDNLHSPTQLFRSLTLTAAPMLPLKISELPKLREYNVNLPINSTFNVYVILVSNPLSFTVQPYNDDFNRLLKMMTQLQDYCMKNDAYIPADMVEIGQGYAAKKADDYYRVIAKARYGEMINVSFCDYGDNGTVRSDQLKVLPNQFRQLPIMGINARLYGIKGKTDDVWSTDDVQRFRDLVLAKKMASFIKGTKRDDKGTLELFLDLIDVQGEEDVNIRQVLLDEKRVLPISN